MTEAQIFWNEVGSKRDFEDPLFIDELAKFIQPHSKIIEYGCGYGRMLRILKDHGYDNISGYDYAPKMIERGKYENPDLEFHLISESGVVPLKDNSCDATIMSTILCCTPQKDAQQKIIQEMKRIVKPGGVIYLSDFVLCDHPRYVDLYQKGLKEHGELGIYTTNENIVVRHHSTSWIMKLLDGLDIQLFVQSDFRTMNNNPARIFHCIAKV